MGEEIPDSALESHHHLLSRSHDYVLVALILVSIALLIINHYRRKSQIALKESEARFQALAERSVVGISVVQDGVSKYVNPRLAEMFGVPEEEIIDMKGPRDFSHPDDLDNVMHSMQRRIDGEEEHAHYETRIITASGEVRDVEVFGSRMIYQGRPALIATMLDITDRKRTAQALQKAHSDLNQIFNSSVPLYVVGKDFTILKVNETFCRHLGRLSADVQGKKCYEIWPGSSCDTDNCAMKRILAGEERIHYEREHNHIDGHKSMFVSSATAYRGPDGTIEGIVASFSDVTELKRREVALRESEERARAQFRSIPVPTYLWQRQGNNFVLIDFNDEASVITKGQIKKLVGKTFDEVLPGRPEWLSDMTRCYNQRTTIRYDEPYKYIFQSTGEQRYLSVTYAFVPPDLVMVHTADVTESTRAEEALKESEGRFRALAEEAPVGIYLAQGGNIAYANPAVKRILGYDIEEIVDAPDPVEFVHADDRQLVLDAVAGFMKGELKSLRFEVRVFGKDGRLRNLEIYTSSTIYMGRPTNIGTVLDITERKLAEAALAESEEKFRLAMEAANDALWDWDVETNQTYRNPRHATMLGYAPEEFGSDQSAWEDRIHPDDRKAILDAINGHIAGKISEVQIEYRLRAKDGGYRWVLGRGKAVGFDDQGRPIRMVGTNQDITERKLAEQALKESEDRFKTLAERSPVGIYVLCDGRFVYANSKVADILGLPQSELMDLPDVNRLAHENDREAVIEAFGRFNRSDKVSTSQAFRVVTREGTLKHVEVYVSKIMWAGKSANIGTLLDVTKKLEAEEALKESERKFRALAETASAAIIIYDEEGLLYTNPAASTITGYSQEELVRVPAWQVVRADYREPLREQAVRRLEDSQKEPGSYEIPIITKSGEERWVLYSGTTIQFGGRPAVLGTAIDITERKAVEAQLQSALKERYSQVAEVAGGVAHEIYNALFPARAVIDKLKGNLGGGDGNGGQPQLVGLAEQSVERAIQMTELVTQFSRLDWDKDVETINLLGLVENLIADEDRIGKLNVVVDLDIGKNTEVNMNRVHAISLFRNLIKNSVDALEEASQRALSITVGSLPGAIQIKVADTGSGIPPETIPKVFSPFFSTKPRTGTGLGLAICKRIVDIYGGSISVESVLDRGTTFTILFKT